MGQDHSPYAHCMALLGAVALAALVLPFRVAAADPYEDDDAWADGSTIEIAAADAQHHDFHDEGDHDWVRFRVLTGAMYQISTSNLGARCDTVIEIYGPSPGGSPGPFVALDDDGGGVGGESLLYVHLDPGVYALLVHQHPDNNVFGVDTEYDLRVDPEFCCNEGWLEGYVTDEATGYRIYGATVRVSVMGNWVNMITDTSGYYEFELMAGSGYPLQVLKANYNTYSGTAPPVVMFNHTRMDVVLTPKTGTGVVAGHVYGIGGAPLDGARVVVSGNQVYTGPDGFYSVRVIAGTVHTFLAQKAYYLDYTQSGIAVTSGGVTTIDATLTALDTDGDGLDDGEEVNSLGTSPLNWDSDGDYIPDGYEAWHMIVSNPLDPLNALDGIADFDGDGNSNVNEYWNGTNPWVKDPVPDPFYPGSPGCYYWGEGDGDGYVLANDKSILLSEVLGMPEAYDNVLPKGLPEDQDMDADGYILAGDLSILKSFIVNSLVGGVGSRAAALEKVYEPISPVAVGGTAHVTVRVRNENVGNNLYSGGFSVLFSIDPSSTGSAVLLGGDGADGPGTRFSVSGPSGASDGGHATMHLKVTSPGTIIVNATIPACGTSGTGRWMDKVTLDPPFTITGQ